MTYRFSAVFTIFFSLECSATLRPPVDEFTPRAARQHRVGSARNQRSFHPTFSLMSWLQNMSKPHFGPRARAKEQSEEMMATTDTLWGRGTRTRRRRRGSVAELAAKDNHMSPCSSTAPTPSVFYLRGDCGLAGSQNDLESNISNHINT